MADLDPLSNMKFGIGSADLGRSPIQLLSDWLVGGTKPSAFDEFGGRSFYTRSGREAIALALRYWNIGDGDEVLAPAYNCGSEVGPIIATGARVVMYRIDSAGRIDFDDLYRRLSARTKLVCVTHYFGKRSEIGDLAEICAGRNIKLLEDCALSLFSADVGRIGDGAIFSLKKSLAASDGGVLILRDAPSGDFLGKVSNRAMLGSALSPVKKWARSIAWPTRGPKAVEGGHFESGSLIVPDIPASYYFPAGARLVSASRLALGLMGRVNGAEIMDRRRRNFAQLRALIDGAGLQFFWESEVLEPGLCPLGLPILVDDRAAWCRQLNRAGVPVSEWWAGHHRGLDWADFPEAATMKRRLLLLPVHQELASRQIRRIGLTVRSLAGARL